jgi:tRNA (guanine37-N1)-methyltransferase
VRIDVVTIFPEAVEPFLGAALLGKARDKKIVDVRVHDLRDHTNDLHRKVDDEPYGGGPGMVMTPEPFFNAVDAIGGGRVVLLSLHGRTFSQDVAREYAALDHLVLLCGRYEGVDERVAKHLVDEELSIGDYVLAGGEAAALVVVDAVVRLLPGVVGTPGSLTQGSFPQYTRPAEFRGWAVPEVLRSGDHAAVERWRRAQALARTIADRPDLIEARGGLSAEERALLERVLGMAYPDPSPAETPGADAP